MQPPPSPQATQAIENECSAARLSVWPEIKKNGVVDGEKSVFYVIGMVIRGFCLYKKVFVHDQNYDKCLEFWISI